MTEETERVIDLIYDRLPEKSKQYLCVVAQKLSRKFTGQIILDCHNGTIAKCHEKKEVK